jgi:hypothetical protein
LWSPTAGGPFFLELNLMAVSFAPKDLETHYWPQTVVEIVSDAQAIGWSPEEIQGLWNVHTLMARLFSGRYRGSGRPFINHLAGTAALALHHGASVTEVLAGYGHAAYEQGEFGRARRGASEANRRELRTVVGDAAEAIIADYGAFDWNRIAARRDIDEVRALSKHEQQLLFLHIVNELDDSFDCGVYDAKWCEACLNRLMAGAEFAKVLEFNTLADQLNARVSYVRSHELASTKAGRRKRSETILNPSSKPRSLLKLRRRLVSFLDRLRASQPFRRSG